MSIDRPWSPSVECGIVPLQYFGLVRCRFAAPMPSLCSCPLHPLLNFRTICRSLDALWRLWWIAKEWNNRRMASSSTLQSPTSCWIISSSLRWYSAPAGMAINSPFCLNNARFMVSGGSRTWCSFSVRHGSFLNLDAWWPRRISVLNCLRLEQRLYFRSRCYDAQEISHWVWSPTAWKSVVAPDWWKKLWIGLHDTLEHSSFNSDWSLS